MKIYIDIVFMINFMFDFLLLLTVNIVLKRNTKLKRIFIGSLIGGLSIFLLFINLNSFELFLFKIIISILMIIITFGKNNFFKNIIYLYFISIILGGFLYYLNMEFSYKNSGLVFFHNGFSINFFLLIILSPIIFYIYIKQAKDLKIINSYQYNISFTYRRKKYNYLGYIDTGNKIYDPYTHKPVILLYDKNFDIDKPIYIPYKTIDNNGLLKTFKVDRLYVDDKEYRKVLIALVDKPFVDGINILLHVDYLMWHIS